MHVYVSMYIVRRGYTQYVSMFNMYVCVSMVHACVREYVHCTTWIHSVREYVQHVYTHSIDCSVQVLLKECEEARGGVVRTSHDLDVSSTSISSSSQVISEQLVTFRSIGELQEQNERLLKVVRELGETREREEADAVGEQTRVSAGREGGGGGDRG